MRKTYLYLRMVQLDEENRDRLHTRYRYIVTNGAMAHTAFYTKNGLEKWAQERGLTLPTLPAPEFWFGAPILSSYSDHMHLDSTEFYALCGDLVRVLSNGQYTLGIVTTDEAGHRTVHHLNPNVHTRPIFDYQVSANLHK